MLRYFLLFLSFSPLQIFKSLAEFQKHVDISIYPTEYYDGEEDNKQVLADFKKRMIAKRDRIEGMDFLEIDKDFIKEDEWFKTDGNGNIDCNGIIGSFRKLEVD